MKLINRHGRCIGVTVLRVGRWLVEAWRCPVGEVVEPHTHPMQDSTLVFLRGTAVLGKQAPGDKKREVTVHGSLRSHVYYIPSATSHWLRGITSPLWFVNISYTRDGVSVESAAVNFQHS